MVLLIYFLAAFGLSYIVGHSRISLPFRELLGGVPVVFDEPDPEGIRIPITIAQRKKEGKDPYWEVRPIIPVVGPFLIAMVECPSCFGFWIGSAAGFIAPGLVPVELRWVATPFWAALVLGWSTAGLNQILSKVTKLA